MKRVPFLMVVAFFSVVLITAIPLAQAQETKTEDPRVKFMREFIEIARQAGLKAPENYGKTDILDGYEAVKDMVIDKLENESDGERDRRLFEIKSLAQGIAELARRPDLNNFELDFSNVKLVNDSQKKKEVVVFEFRYPANAFFLVGGRRYSGLRWQIDVELVKDVFKIRSANWKFIPLI